MIQKKFKFCSFDCAYWVAGWPTHPDYCTRFNKWLKERIQDGKGFSIKLKECKENK